MNHTIVSHLIADDSLSWRLVGLVCASRNAMRSIFRLFSGTLLLASMLIGQSAFANTSNYTYKYTFLNGDTITGNFKGEVDAIHPDFLWGHWWNQDALLATYKIAATNSELSVGWDSFSTSGLFPSNGDVDGLHFVLFHDSDGTGYDQFFGVEEGYIFFLHENGSYVNPEILTSEKIRASAWELFPRVPESGPTVLLFGIGILGLLAFGRKCSVLQSSIS